MNVKWRAKVVKRASELPASSKEGVKVEEGMKVGEDEENYPASCLCILLRSVCMDHTQPFHEAGSSTFALMLDSDEIAHVMDVPAIHV